MVGFARDLAVRSAIDGTTARHHCGRVRKSTNFYIAGLNNMKKSATIGGESPSRLIDARIKELDDWRGKTLSHVRALVISLMGTLMSLDI